MSIIPYVIEQTSRGERSYDIFPGSSPTESSFLGEEVTDASASSSVAQMLFLEAQEALAYGLIDKMIDKR